MSRPVLELPGVPHRYDSHLVLRDVDLTAHGDFLGFLGHNGVGKTPPRPSA